MIPTELIKADCEVCGAKNSITRIIETHQGFFLVYNQCSACTSEYAGADDFKLSKLLNKSNKE